jgi:putative transcriptional regulator
MIGAQSGSIDALLARYVAGALPRPARVLVESHLEIKSENRAYVADLEGLAGEALEVVDLTPVSDRRGRLEAVFAAPELAGIAPRQKSPSSFPRALRDFAGFDVGDVPWRTKLPGFRVHDFGEVDGCEMSLFWIRPGRALPSHTHLGSELTLILEGSFTDDIGHYERGDISIADETVDHRPVAGKERPCIALAVTDAPLKFTGPLFRRLADILFA